MIVKLYEVTGVEPRVYYPAKSGHTVDEMTTTSQETPSVWEIRDLEVLLQSAKEVYNTNQWDKEYALTKKMIKALNIFWIDVDTFPFYSLTFCLTVDTKGVPFQQIMTSILEAVRPIRALFDSLGGVTTKLVSYRPCTPFLVYLGVQNSKEEVETLLKNILAIEKLQNPVNDRPQFKQIHYYSREVLKFEPLSSLDLSSSKITALLQYANIFPFVGYWKERYSGLKHHFIITISDDENTLQQQPNLRFSSIPMFSISGFNSAEIYHPVYGPGYFVRLLSITSWLRYLIMIVRNDDTFRELREGVERSLADGDRNALREHLMNLNREGSLVVHFRANVAEFHTELDPDIMPILEQEEQTIFHEVPIMSYQQQHRLNDHQFIRSMNASIVAKINQLQHMLDQRITESEHTHTHVSNIVNLDIQETMTRFTRISTRAGIASAIAAGVAIAITVIFEYLKPPT